MVVTRKIKVRITSNLLHNISTSICIRKCNKNAGPNVIMMCTKSSHVPQTTEDGLSLFVEVQNTYNIHVHVHCTL